MSLNKVAHAGQGRNCLVGKKVTRRNLAGDVLHWTMQLLLQFERNGQALTVDISWSIDCVPAAERERVCGEGPGGTESDRPRPAPIARP